MGKKFVRAGEELEDWMVEESLWKQLLNLERDTMQFLFTVGEALIQCLWSQNVIRKPTPLNYSNYSVDEMQMDTNIVIVPNSAVIPRKALRLSPNESMDQKVNKDSNRARIFRHWIDRQQKHIFENDQTG